MFVYLSFYTLYYCIYIPKIVKKLRIHQSYSLNPHFYIRSIHSPPKNTPKHQVYTLAKRFKAGFQVIFLFRRHFSPPWLEPPNPQKQRSYRLFQPLSFVIRAIHSTWQVPKNKSVQIHSLLLLSRMIPTPTIYDRGSTPLFPIQAFPMSQMGHSDIATTRNIYYYNRNSEDERKKIISKVINY